MKLASQIAVAALLVTAPLAARAQAAEGPSDPPDEAGGDEGPVFTPPELIEYVQADYPPEAFAAGIEAAVVARMYIDETGMVTAVEVLEPAGQGFDEAATEAMRRFVFSPAMRDDEPIAAAVDYRYTFFIEKDEPSLEEELRPPVANLAGQVTDMDGAPIIGASLVIVPLA
ncbi:MAG: energy transducer TonB, partial [Deltaproteobacteria bacterium]|nr:energy transducer TonB [Deltaproteobacteria bacterium]